MLARAAEAGFTFYISPEIEFFYFKDANGTEPLDSGGYFDLTPLDGGSDLRRETVLALEQMGIGVALSHHEAAPSQHEMDLRYTDALTMADAVMTYRLLVKEVALRHDVYATFMPKPLANENGSGMHLQLSLFRGEANAFYEEGDPAAHLPGRAAVHRRAVAARAGADAADQPVGELVQAAGPGHRGAALRDVVAEESLGPGTGARVQAGARGIDAGRIPGCLMRRAIRTSRSRACSRRACAGSRRG